MKFSVRGILEEPAVHRLRACVCVCVCVCVRACVCLSVHAHWSRGSWIGVDTLERKEKHTATAQPATGHCKATQQRCVTRTLMSEKRDEVATKHSTKPANPSCWKKSNQSRAADMGMMPTASTVVIRTSRMVRFLEGGERRGGEGGEGRGEEGRGEGWRGEHSSLLLCDNASNTPVHKLL